MNYPVGDFLIRLKNASLAGKKEIVAPAGKKLLLLIQRRLRLLEESC